MQSTRREPVDAAALVEEQLLAHLNKPTGRQARTRRTEYSNDVLTDAPHVARIRVGLLKLGLQLLRFVLHLGEVLIGQARVLRSEDATTGSLGTPSSSACTR